MGLTYEQALSKIGTEGYTGVQGLRRLVSETSVIPANTSHDATLLLYSNDVGGQWAWQVAGQISDSAVETDGLKRVYTIADTAVSELLNDETFLDALERSVFSEGGDNQTYALILEGKDANGIRMSNQSLWDMASHNLAGSATGNIVTIAENAHLDSVFVQSEIDAALNSQRL